MSSLISTELPVEVFWPSRNWMNLFSRVRKRKFNFLVFENSDFENGKDPMISIEGKVDTVMVPHTQDQWVLKNIVKINSVLKEKGTITYY